jgi:plasmid maintenance system killer protein
MSDAKKISDDVLAKLSRHLNIIHETTASRKLKVKALDEVYSTLKQITNIQALQIIFPLLLKDLLLIFKIEIENCREKLVLILQIFTTQISVTTYLINIIPVYRDKLTALENSESSEEIRHLLIKTMLDMVNFSKGDYSSYVEDTVAILLITLSDSYPEVRKVLLY